MQKKLWASLLVLVALWAVPIWAGAAAQTVVNRVVAVVDDEVITTQDVKKMIVRLESTMKPARSEAEKKMRESQLERMAVETLIDERIIFAEAKRLNLAVSAREVDTYIDRLKQNNGLSDEEFLARLSRQGVSLKEYREGLANDLLKHRVLNREVYSQVVISDEQVEEYLKKQGKGPVESEKVTVRALFLTIPQNAQPQAVEVLRKKAEEYKKIAIEKKSMADLADKYSQGPGAGQGGMLGPLVVADLSPSMRQALIGLKEGEYSDVFEVSGTLVFLQLVKRSKETVTVGDEVKAQIRAKLESEAREKKAAEWMKELRSKTYIKRMNAK